MKTQEVFAVFLREHICFVVCSGENHFVFISVRLEKVERVSNFWR